MKKYHTHERGIALLITLLIMTVLLGVSASLLNITLKQYQFANIGLASEMAFQAANAGMECMLAHDYELYPFSKFDVGEVSPTVECMDGVSDTGSAGTIESAEPQYYQFSWGTPEVCSDVTVYKFFEDRADDGDTTGPDMEAALGRTGTCPEDVICTVIRSRGYNVGCPGSGNSFPPRTIERELTQRY
jgi:Tfp pilus assembly protein PilX